MGESYPTGESSPTGEESDYGQTPTLLWFGWILTTSDPSTHKHAAAAARELSCEGEHALTGGEDAGDKSDPGHVVDHVSGHVRSLTGVRGEGRAVIRHVTALGHVRDVDTP
eukprot:3778217-Rhodomonas_salina.1